MIVQCIICISPLLCQHRRINPPLCRPAAHAAKTDEQRFDDGKFFMVFVVDVFTTNEKKTARIFMRDSLFSCASDAAIQRKAYGANVAYPTSSVVRVA